MTRKIEKLIQERMEIRRDNEIIESDVSLDELIQITNLLNESTENVKAERVISKFRSAFRSNKVGSFRQFMDTLLDILS